MNELNCIPCNPHNECAIKETIPFILVGTTKEQRDNQLTALTLDTRMRVSTQKLHNYGLLPHVHSIVALCS